MPAEKQVEAVSKKLMELNPGFDGKVTASGSKDTPRIEQGVVTDVGLIANHLTDISPVRAFAGLKSLGCNGYGMKSEFSDLSPLQGMQLTDLGCSATQVSDLTPLKGMALKNLSCHVSRVEDLSPIQGMPLIDLNVSITAVSDLSPLKGMKLVRINCGGTKVTDISVLKGMPLITLNCYGTQVSDPSPLEDCKSLTWLGLRQNKVTPASVAALQKALPNCKIDWDDPSKPKTPEPAASGSK
jgi:Leucine-rich repeat (LRR) protein